jgi:hypothetical protein
MRNKKKKKKKPPLSFHTFQLSLVKTNIDMWLIDTVAVSGCVDSILEKRQNNLK